jgi:predicted nucleic acid-binding protein
VIVVDASVLIAYLASDDPHHAPSLEILSLDDSFIVHTITLAEALVKGQRSGRMNEVATTFASLGVQEAERQAGEARSLAALRGATRLTMPDCCVLMLAEAQSSTLATFDLRLARAARERRIEVLDGSA